MNQIFNIGLSFWEEKNKVSRMWNRKTWQKQLFGEALPTLLFLETGLIGPKLQFSESHSASNPVNNKSSVYRKNDLARQQGAKEQCRCATFPDRLKQKGSDQTVQGITPAVSTVSKEC